MSCLLVPPGSGGITPGAWVSANDPLAIPFALTQDTIVTQLAFQNGSAAGGNMDMGIYDLSWNRLVSMGSTACVTNNAMQYVNVTDTFLAPGRYYVVMVRDNVTANRGYFFPAPSGANFMSFLGVQDSATDAFPLPNPLTNMAAAATMTRIPQFQIATRTLL